MKWTRCITGRCLFGAADARRSHMHGVWSLWWDASGALWSGDAGGELRRWDPKTGRTLQRWLAHKGPVRGLVVRPNGWLISAGDDEVVRVWDTKTQKLLHNWKVRGRISSLALSPDGTWLAAASTDRHVWLRRLVTKPGAPAAKWSRWKGHTDAVRSVAFDASGDFLVSASDDRSVRVWDVGTGKIAQVMKGHRGWVRKAVFGPKGSDWIASGSFDLTLHIWARKSGKLRQRWGRPVDPFSVLSKVQARLPTPTTATQTKDRHRSDISDVVGSPSGKWLLATGHRGAIIHLPDDGTTARLWRRKDGQLACHLKGHQLGLTRAVFAPKGGRFATASEDGTIRVYRYQKKP